MDTFRS